jgi:signal transduction histidine kinase
MRTPLNSICGFLELLAGTELDEQQRHWLSLARTASDHLISIIDYAPSIASAGADAIDLVVENVALDSVVLESVLLIEPIATARPTTLQLVSDSDIDLMVHADRARLRQVFFNLLSNAIKFGPPASTVTVTTRRVENRARIEVRDEGSGIDPSLSHRLFVPFDRLDASERGFTGVGLGLSLSRTLMQAMGGTLEVANDAGSGTAFHVELPLDPLT